MSDPGPVVIDELTRLLIEAACVDERRARKSWQEWCACVDFDGIDDRLQRLLPAIAPRQHVLTPGDPLRGKVRGLYRRSWVNNRLLWNAATPALRELQGAGVEFAVVGTAAMAAFYHGDIGARPMELVDLLVTPQQARRAKQILAEWQQRSDPAPLSLRDRAVATSIGAHADDAWWAASTPRLAGAGRDLQPADLLLHLLIGAGDGDGSCGWVIDANRIVVTRRDLGPRLAAQARAHGVIDTCLERLNSVCALTEPPGCDSLLADLRDARPRFTERLVKGRHGRRRVDRALAALAAHSSGSAGVRSGLVSLVADRLDLDLHTHPAVAVVNAALGRPLLLSRVRSKLGPSPLVRGGDPPAVGVGACLDFRHASTLDTYGGPGWRGTSGRGAQSKSNESRLILRVDNASRLRAVIRLTVDQQAPVLVYVDGRRCAATRAGGGPTEVDFSFSVRPGRRIVEIVLRSGDRRFIWSRPLQIALQSVDIRAPLVRS